MTGLQREDICFQLEGKLLKQLPAKKKPASGGRRASEERDHAHFVGGADRAEQAAGPSLARVAAQARVRADAPPHDSVLHGVVGSCQLLFVICGDSTGS